MPYIPQQQRNDIHNDMQDLGIDITPENAGELNYIISQLIDNYLIKHNTSYSAINEMIGALECCKLELYRMVAASYEDEKMLKNGAVYTETGNV